MISDVKESHVTLNFTSSEKINQIKIEIGFKERVLNSDPSSPPPPTLKERHVKKYQSSPEIKSVIIKKKKEKEGLPLSKTMEELLIPAPTRVLSDPNLENVKDVRRPKRTSGAKTNRLVLTRIPTPAPQSVPISSRRKGDDLTSPRVPEKEDSTQRGVVLTPPIEKSKRKKKNLSKSTQLLDLADATLITKLNHSPKVKKGRMKELAVKIPNSSHSRSTSTTLKNTKSNHSPKVKKGRMKELAVKIPNSSHSRSTSTTLKKRKAKPLTSSRINLTREKEQEAAIQKEKKVKELLRDCGSKPLSRLEIKEIVLFIIRPAYSQLYLLCQQQYTEEHIEFLFDYVNWIQKNEHDNDVLHFIIQKYIECDSVKTINIEGSTRNAVITAFDKKDFINVKILLEGVSETIIALLWQNVFFYALGDHKKRELILNVLKQTHQLTQ
jgi:hypothetical protein